MCVVSEPANAYPLGGVQIWNSVVPVRRYLCKYIKVMGPDTSDKAKHVHRDEHADWINIFNIYEVVYRQRFFRMMQRTQKCTR